MVVILAAANRDPEAINKPGELDITRKTNNHLGFGYGVHYCLGAPLARLEGQIAFNTLLERLPTMQLAIPPAQLKYNETSIVHGIVRLPVRW